MPKSPEENNDLQQRNKKPQEDKHPQNENKQKQDEDKQKQNEEEFPSPINPSKLSYLPTPQLCAPQQPLRPKRGVKKIFEEYGFDPDFPPTLAQFIDQQPDEEERKKLVVQFSALISTSQAWDLEDQRQRVLARFPRAFDHDLTDEEKNYVAMLMDIESEGAVCSIGTKIMFFGTIFFIIVVIVMYWILYRIDLLWHIHVGLLSSLSLTNAGSIYSAEPRLLDVIMNPLDYQQPDGVLYIPPTIDPTSSQPHVEVVVCSVPEPHNEVVQIVQVKDDVGQGNEVNQTEEKKNTFETTKSEEIP